jgi:hypothetical protein
VLKSRVPRTDPCGAPENTTKGDATGSHGSASNSVIIIIIIQLNSLFLCATSTARRPITDTAQTNTFKKLQLLLPQ